MEQYRISTDTEPRITIPRGSIHTLATRRGGTTYVNLDDLLHNLVASEAASTAVVAKQTFRMLYDQLIQIRH